jgi:hypothetical protein
MTRTLSQGGARPYRRNVDERMEEPMTSRGAIPLALGTVILGCWLSAPFAGAQTNNPGTLGNPTGDTAVSGAVEQKPLLTPAQRSAIYAEVSKDKSKTSPKDFSPVIGADVPPMIELYALPDDALATAPEAKLYEYTMVENKVVIVDPTRMRVVDVIGPAAPPQ